MIKRLFPAIMVINPFCIQENLRKLEKLGFTCLHADVLDGVFTPYISYGHSYYEAIAKNTFLPLEIHLQVEDPIKQIKQFDNSLFERIIVHIERIEDYSASDLLSIITPCKLGIAINPQTSIDKLSPFLSIKRLDKIVLMASDPGTSEINELIFNKIPVLKNKLEKEGRSSDISIQIDAGVRKNNIAKFAINGVDEFVCASALFGGGDDIDTNCSMLISELGALL